jgi:hypothetical protein
MFPKAQHTAHGAASFTPGTLYAIPQKILLTPASVPALKEKELIFAILFL